MLAMTIFGSGHDPTRANCRRRGFALLRPALYDTECATCGSTWDLVPYDNEGTVCFCRACLDELDAPFEWVDLGAGD